jgi:hypothetical protein
LAKWLAGRADSFNVSIETELQNLDNVREESARLYDSLQEAVDQQSQKTGFVPPGGYGMEADKNGVWNWLWYGSENRARIVFDSRMVNDPAGMTSTISA